MTTELVGDVRDRLAADGAEVDGLSAWANAPGDRYAAHAHGYDKVLVVTHGSITFRLPALGVSHVLRAGDRLDLPAGTLHAADVGPEGVRCLEGHLGAGSLHPYPRPMADWAPMAPGSRPPRTDGDAET